MVRKPQNSNDMNSKFEKVVRELRAKFRGGELHAKLGGGVLPWGRWFSRLRGVIRALVHANLPQSGQIHINGVGRDQGFRAPELCAVRAIGLE